ncbi:hypothetical protein CR51_13835 [Caballeronia megalochromosomata]|nr:hypothetical protein CR51_13835 [Caballeronia megalochromosomata]
MGDAGRYEQAMSKINDIEPSPSESNRTRIDDHPMLAGLSLILGGAITFFYFAAFSEFNNTGLPWKLTGSLTLVSSALVLVQFATNRSERRLIWEGFAALCLLVGLWLFTGSCWLFYFSFAPIPAWLRWNVIVPGVVGTAHWLRMVWKDYKRDVQNLNLVERLYKFEDDRIVYPGQSSDLLVGELTRRNPFTKLHLWAVPLGPLFGAIALGFAGHFRTSGGPHLIFLIASFFTFPMSQFLLGYGGAKTLYFHIYLPLKMERLTGKRVILAP